MNKEGVKIYTTDAIVEDQEFAESKHSQASAGQQDKRTIIDADGFMNLPDGIEEGLPFN